MESLLTQITNYLFAQSLQTAVLIILIVFISFLLKSKSAHIRYFLWMIVLAKCLVPPFYTVPLAVLPQQEIPVQLPSQPIVETMITEKSVPELTLSELPESIPDQTEVLSTPISKDKKVSYNARALLAIGWLIGFLALSLYYIINALRTQIWLRNRRIELPNEYRNKIESLFITHSVKKIPHIWMLEQISQPFVWGLVRGSIYLPAEMTSKKNATFHTSLLGHELSHVIRFDALINSLQIIAQSIFWFHPLIWWTNRKIRQEREKCCDEMTIARSNTLPEDYSEAIVEILAAKYGQARRVPSLAVAGKAKNIEERIKTMLRPGKKFYKRPTIITIFVFIMVTLVSIPIGCALTRRSENDHSPVIKDFYTGLQRPDGIVCLDKDNLIVVLESSDEYGPGIIKCKRGDAYSPDDVFSKLGPPYVGPDGLIQLPDGRFIVTDGQARTVFEVPKEGGPPKVFLRGITSYNNPAIAPSGFDGPNVDPGDLLIPIWLPASIIAVNPTTKEIKTFIDHSFFSSFCRQGVGSLEFGPDNKLYMAWSDYWEDKEPPRIYCFDSNGNGEIFLELDDYAYNRPHFSIEIDQNDGWLYYYNSPIQPSPYSPRGTIYRISLDKSINEFVVDIGMPSQNIELSPDGKNLYLGAVKASKVIKEIQNVNLLTKRESQTNSSVETYKILANSLHKAVTDGEIEKVNLLISKGADVNAKNNTGMTALDLAEQRGHIKIVELLKKHGAKESPYPNTNSNQAPKLRQAVEDGNIERVKQLIEEGADVNVKYRRGTTVLHLASGVGRMDMVELLVSKGAKINAPDKNGWTPLHEAADKSHVDIVKFLMAEGAEFSPIHMAAYFGELDKIKSLVVKDVNVNEKDTVGFTPLHSAVCGKQIETADFLLNNNTDANAKDNYGLSPLVWAIWNHDLNMIKLLVDKGAKADVPDEQGFAPLTWAVWEQNKDIVKILISKEPNINTEDTTGCTPLYWGAFSSSNDVFELFLDRLNASENIHFAACKGNLDTVKTFLEKDSNVNVKDKFGCTPLHWAALAKTNEVAEFLIDKGADVNARDKNGLLPLTGTHRLDMIGLLISKGVDVNAKINNRSMTKLHLACQQDNKDMVEYLISKGADVNTKNNRGVSPLHISARFGYRDIAELLISSGADVNAKNNTGQTSLNIATNLGHTEIVELLKKHGAKISVEMDNTPPLEGIKVKINDLIGKRFTFLWTDGGEEHINGILLLKDDGTIGLYSHPNESTWKIDEEGRMLIMHKDGRVATILNKIEINNGKYELRGPFLLRSNIYHILREQ